MENICFYDVDTQHDFMDENGALYVPGAEAIKPRLEVLTRFALGIPYDYTDPESGRRYQGVDCSYGITSYPVFGSVDKHYANDDELKVFPPHCMDSTEGQKKIPETNLPRSLFAIHEFLISRSDTYDEACLKDPWFTEREAYIENRAYSAGELKAKMSATAVYFEKQEVSVFSNANAGLLKRFDAAVVYGVATEYCVKAAVLGMRQRGLDVLVVEDAIKGITPEGEKAAIEEMKAAGAKFIKTKDVLEGRVEQILNEIWRQ